METTSSHNVIFSIPAWQTILFSTTAPQLAVLFTNPFDTAKVRLQLQNKTSGQVVYKNSFDCLLKIMRNEGIAGLQKGLFPAVLREGSKNVFRLGLFDPLMRLLHNPKTEVGPIPMWKRIVAGGLSGAMGAAACNPFELIKTRMQAATRGNISVGHQYQYSGLLNALSTIVRKEGFFSLYRGSGMSVLRSCLGSGANLSTYSYFREYVLTNNYMSDNSLTDASCSMASSFITAMIMNPVDVVRTRIYNQPLSETGQGLLYKGGVDAFTKILRTEGPTAFFKGSFTSFMRLGPHFTLTFVFLEQMKRFSLSTQQWSYQRKRSAELRTLFNQYDLDQNQVLSEDELIRMIKATLPPRSEQDSFLSEWQYNNLIKQHVDKLLSSADTNRNRVIEFEEFDKVQQVMQQIVRDHEVASAFLYFDRDCNGKIDREEMFRALKSLVPAPQSQKNNRLQMSTEQHDTLLKNALDMVMERYDTNGSGYIELDEFAEIAKSLPRVEARLIARTVMTEAGITNVM